MNPLEKNSKGQPDEAAAARPRAVAIKLTDVTMRSVRGGGGLSTFVAPAALSAGTLAAAIEAVKTYPVL